MVALFGATNDGGGCGALRPGRFELCLEVAPPSEAARKQVLEIHTRRMPLASDVDLHKLAQATSNYTGEWHPRSRECHCFCFP